MSQGSARYPFAPITRWIGAISLALLALSALPVFADPVVIDNPCDAPGDAPDVIVGDLVGVSNYAPIGTISAYAIGTTSCNIGTCWLEWISGTNHHPAIGQGMYRLKSGRFEQIGQSWLKHGFTALSGNVCSSSCLSTDGTHLGVNCSDPYSSGLNGQQNRLGPKFEVHAYTGVFPYPPTNGSSTGNSIYKRLQVHNDDLNPALNPGASYFVEGQYVTLDDAAAKNQNNNASYRTCSVSAGVSPIVWSVSLTGTTQRMKTAIEAWKVADPTVTQVDTQMPNDGRVLISAKATFLGGSTYHYEYAIENLNSDRGIQSFVVPVPPGANVTNIGFHDVDYHSGEPFDGTDWPGAVVGNTVTWSTTPFATNPNANALRWGTLYNFRFDADVAPATDNVTLVAFLAGGPPSLSVATVTPNMCNHDGVCGPGETCGNCVSDCASQGGGSGCCGNGICEAGENPCRCAADCGVQHPGEFPCSGGVDEDCDGLVDCADPECCTDGACAGVDPDHDGYAVCDCDNSNPQVWAKPGEALNMHIGKSTEAGDIVVVWDPPVVPGGSVTSFDVLRSPSANDFVAAASCVAMPDPTAHQAVDSINPGAGNTLSYLVRAKNACPGGSGLLGTGSNGQPIPGRSCP